MKIVYGAKMTKYHVNDSGDVKPCRATIKCPLGEETIHGDNPQEARALYEKSKEAEMFSTVNKNKNLAKKDKFTMAFVRAVPPNTALYAEAMRQKEVLAKAKAEKRSLSTQEFARHKKYVAYITTHLEKQGLTTDNINSIDSIGDQAIYSQERLKEHQEIIDIYLEKAKKVPNEGKALISGGLGGAGKSSTIKAYDIAGKNDYITINPDDIKEIMAEKGMIPDVPGTLPMEVNSLAHEEASALSKRIMVKMLSEKKNILLDLTMASIGSTEKKLDQLKRNGYKTNALFVDIDVETSRERGAYRYISGMNENIMTDTGSGGRFLPDKVLDSQKPTLDKMKSLNAENLVRLVGRGWFDNAPKVFDNSGDGPVEIDYTKFARPVLFANND